MAGGVAVFNVARVPAAAQGSLARGQVGRVGRGAANEEHRTILPKSRLICACAVQRAKM
jgi:hypothetical protein